MASQIGKRKKEHWSPFYLVKWSLIYLIPKLLRNLSAFEKNSGEGGSTWFQRWWATFFVFNWYFSSKIWGDNQSPNTLRNFYLYKIRLKTIPYMIKKEKGRGSQDKIEKNKRKQIFFRMASLTVLGVKKKLSPKKSVCLYKR